MLGHMVKRVCGFCLGSVWEYPVQELPGCCEEDLQLGTNAPGSTEQFIYRYLLCYHKSSRTFVHIFNLAEITNTLHVLTLIDGQNENLPSMFLRLSLQTAAAKLKTSQLSCQLTL